jgi:hypothetical protein
VNTGWFLYVFQNSMIYQKSWNAAKCYVKLFFFSSFVKAFVYICSTAIVLTELNGVSGTPVRSERLADFLRRERQTLARRRDLLSSKITGYLPPVAEVVEADAVAEASVINERQRASLATAFSNVVATECRNATFQTRSEILAGGFNPRECKRNPNCDVSCQCVTVEDEVCQNQTPVQGCRLVQDEVCELVEEEFCDEEPTNVDDDIPDQVCNNE